MTTDRKPSQRFGQIVARLYSRSGFRGPVLTLLSGSGLALVLSYLAQLVLARLYPPEAFGVSDYFVMAVTVLLAFSSFRYEDAVMTPAGERESNRIILLALSLTGIVALVLGVLSIWSEAVTSALGVPELSPWLWLIPVALFLTKGVRLVELWLSRRKEFRTITGGQVSATGATVATRIGAGAASPGVGAGGLIGGFVAGQVVSLAVLLPKAVRLRRIPVPGDAGDAPPTLAAAAVRYRRYAAYSTPAAVLNAAFSRLPTILLPLFFSWTVVGYYGRAYVALAVPLGLIGSAVAQVFFVHAGEAVRTNTLSGLSEQVHARLVMLGMLPTIAVMLAGPELFDVLFGDLWRPAGEYLRFVAPWLFLAGVASPLTRLFDVLERQRADLITSIVMFALQGAALVVGGQTGDVAFTLLLLGLTGTVARAGHIVVMLRLSQVSLRGIFRPYGRFALQSLLPALLIAAAVRFTPDWFVVVTVVAALGVYYLALAAREGLFSGSEDG